MIFDGILRWSATRFLEKMVKSNRSKCTFATLKEGALLWQRDAFLEYDKTNLPIAYLEKGKTIGMFATKYSHTEMVGGITIISGFENFRTMELSPIQFFPKSSAVEINGLWIHRFLSKECRLRFWIEVCRILVKMDPDTEVYFSFEVRKTKLIKFYERITKEIIYEGTVNHCPGMDLSLEYKERICKTTIRYLLYSIPSALKAWIKDRKCK